MPAPDATSSVLTVHVTTRHNRKQRSVRSTYAQNTSRFWSASFTRRQPPSRLVSSKAPRIGLQDSLDGVHLQRVLRHALCEPSGTVSGVCKAVFVARYAVNSGADKGQMNALVQLALSLSAVVLAYHGRPNTSQHKRQHSTHCCAHFLARTSPKYTPIPACELTPARRSEALSNGVNSSCPPVPSRVVTRGPFVPLAWADGPSLLAVHHVIPSSSVDAVLF